jgi:drug/metabolite transporter (DMT)-like permease
VRSLVGLRRRVAEAVEAIHLRGRVDPNVVPLGQVAHELSQSRAQLVREVRGGGPHECVDVVAGRLGHDARKRIVSGLVRRVQPVDLMLLGTVLLWALNATVTRYVLTHGFRPLSYATIRYGAAVLLFWSFTYVRERTFRFNLRDLKLVALAALAIFCNQICFVYSIDLTSAATVTLFLGTTPIFIGLLVSAIGLERLGRTFWAATAISFVGVGFVASGSGGFSGHVAGDGLAVLTAVTWAIYSVAVTPLMRRYSPFRISAVVLLLGWIPLAIVGATQTSEQSLHFGWLTWAGFGFAVVGPLFLTNLLWFTAIDRVGPSRASLFSNLQPLFGVGFALLLLGEHLSRWEVVGGAAILGAVLAERMRRTPAQPPAN